MNFSIIGLAKHYKLNIIHYFSSDPLEAGMFRRTQVFVGDHIPPHADHIEVLMKSFVSWLNSPEAIGNVTRQF